MLREGTAPRMLVTGVYEDVRPGEFAAAYNVSPQLMDCCVTLGFAALDTRGNARETAVWVAENKVRSIRLVTSDWHMRRAALRAAASSCPKAPCCCATPCPPSRRCGRCSSSTTSCWRRGSSQTWPG